MNEHTHNQDTAILMPPDTPKDRYSQETVKAQVEKFVINIEDQSSDFLGANRKGRKVSLWLSDALILCLEHLQIFALILSLSLGWAWPQVWIKGTSFAFLMNLDLWEFTKVHTVYEGQIQAYVDPIEVPFSYQGYSIAWLVAIIILTALFALTYFAVPKIPYFGVVYRLLLRAKLVRIFTLLAQVFCFPFGLVVVRLFNCQNYPISPSGLLEFRSIVLSDTQCWSGPHLGILVPLLIVAVIYFIVLPCWMIYKIRNELISPVLCTYHIRRNHESHVCLKEAEYVRGLDIAWETRYYPLFSSFRRPWVWFRPFSFLVKGLILALYGSLFYIPYYQTIVLFACVCVIVLVLAVIPVYRLHSFNFMLIFSIVVNLCNLVLGLVLILQVQSSLLVGVNLTNALVVINVSWFVVVGLWFCYLFLRSTHFVKQRFGPMWPALTEFGRSKRNREDHTRKFFKAILAGRKVLEKCYSSPSLFAPVHELSRQIQIVNAYYREAEVLQDTTHGSLWALLAEMIDLHNHLLPLSVFGASRTDKVYPHIKELMDLVPDFSSRLEKREYDFILWTPLKRRILLKLLVVATFLGKRRSGQTRNVWQSRQHSQCSQWSNRISQVSTLTNILQDQQAQENDDFISELEKWEADRQVSKENRFPSLGSLQTDEDLYSRNIQAWEDRCSLSKDRQFIHSPPISRGVYSAGLSAGYLPNKEASSPFLTSDKPSRPTSKLGVRFNPLNTIAEYDINSRSTSAMSYRTESRSSTDRLLDNVSQQLNTFY